MTEKSPEGEAKGEADVLEEKASKDVETSRIYGDATGGEEMDIGEVDDSDWLVVDMALSLTTAYFSNSQSRKGSTLHSINQPLQDIFIRSESHEMTSAS